MGCVAENLAVKYDITEREDLTISQVPADLAEAAKAGVSDELHL